MGEPSPDGAALEASWTAVQFASNQKLWDPWGEIVTALIDAGLHIDRLQEYPFLEWSADFLVESEPGR